MRKLKKRTFFWAVWRAKYNKLPLLSRYLRRNMLPFAERQSPPLKTGRSKLRKGVKAGIPDAPRGIIGGRISDDNSDFTTPYPSATRNYTNRTGTDNGTFIQLSNIEGRRPLHERSFSYSPPQNQNIPVKSRSPKSTSTRLWSRQSSAPYNARSEKEINKLTDSQDDEVEFVRELKADNRRKTQTIRRVEFKKVTNERKHHLEEVRKPENMTSTRKHDIEKRQFFKCSSTRTNDQEAIAALNNDNCLVIDEPQCNGGNLQDVSMQSNISSVESDDDLVVVSGDHCGRENITFPTLKRIVTAVVHHYAEENNCEDMSVQYVLNRLKTLHNRDFSDRFTEVEYCTRRALERYQRGQSKKLFKEVRPGVRHMDIDTLSSDNWLNDVIINEYMMLLATEQESCGAISSFWYDELCKGKEPNLPYCWKNLSYILAPICTDSHWSLLCFTPSSYSVDIYSSLSVTQREFHYAKELRDFFRRKTNVYDRGKCMQVPDLPHQENKYDCGVYVCMFARCIVCGNSYNISPQQVLEFRNWLKKEIVTERLLGARQSDSDDDTSSEASYQIVVDSQLAP